MNLAPIAPNSGADEEGIAGSSENHDYVVATISPTALEKSMRCMA